MKYILVMFGTEGFETVVDVTDGHPDNLGMIRAMAKLAGEAEPDDWVGKLAFKLSTRAQFNPQRFYECYVIGVDEGMDEDDIRTWTDMDPQGAADWIREWHFYRVFDHRNRVGKTVIS